MPVAWTRLIPVTLLVAVSLGTAAAIEMFYECFGLDGDPVDFGRACVLGALAFVCAAIAAALVAESCSGCRNANGRARLRRRIFDQLPFGGSGVRFTAIVALLQSVCMAMVQFGDPAPNAREDFMGWATSLLLVLLGTVVVRCLLRLMPRLAPLAAVFFIGIVRPNRPAWRVRVMRSRPMAGCETWPRMMFKRPPPRLLNA
ncbi:MAG: hypothetical protein GIX01_13055 [Candidatus Eremiobacteraeota bacterium]|nr:hypothetical protein [Candidatus Eremiobacteraeota bacterium]